MLPPRKVEYCSVPFTMLRSDTNATPFATPAPGGGMEPTVTGKFADEVVPVI